MQFKHDKQFKMDFQVEISISVLKFEQTYNFNPS